MRFLKIFTPVFLSTFFVAGNIYAQIEFIENKGQWDPQVKFMSHAGNGAFFLQQKGFTVLMHDPKDIERLNPHYIGTVMAKQKNSEEILHSHAYRVEFMNANPEAEIIPDKPVPTVNNYFIGNDQSKWASNCKIYKGVTYKNVYPNVDVRYYTDGAGNLKYDLIVYPGGDPNQIKLQYKGADKLLVKDRELIIKTSIGDNKELYPYTYQVMEKSRTELDCRFVVDGDVVKFKVKNYARDKTLVIDPSEIFFTYSGSTADNWGFTATYGPDGSFYSGGIAFSQGFPQTIGAFQTSYAGDRDIAIMKLTPDGVSKVYSTYLGGAGKEQPHSLVVDPQGNLIVAGRTNSPTSNGAVYPVTAPLFGPCGNWDIIVTKLNASGSGLIGSIRIGGGGEDGVNISTDENSGVLSIKRNYGDDARSEVIIDGSNNIYLASCTKSSNFPTTPGVIKPNFTAKQDAVVLKLNPNCNGVLWSTYLGGSEDDASYVLALGNNNNLYVAGGTGSSNLTGISGSGVISSSSAGGVCDGFIIELSNDGSTAIRGTYLGTTSADQVYGIQTDKNGNIYVMGTTEGAWPVINAAFVNPGSKQFVSKIKPDLSDYIYSTVFGSGSTLPNISPTAFLVDRCENVYVSGWGGISNTKTGYPNSSTKGMPVTSDAIKATTDASGSDFYFIVIKKDAASQLYGTFFGQEDGNNGVSFGDHVDGGTSRFDKMGVVYQAICANCFRSVSFVGTPGSWSPNNPATQDSKCNLGMLKIEMDFAGVAAAPQASINGVPNDTTGCTPLLVRFTDTLLRGKTYVWDFGDGSPRVTSSGPDTSHTYLAPGNYRVTLIAIDSTTCNIADSAHLTIRVGNNKANLDFVSTKLPPCTNLTYSFDNTSTPTFGNFGATSFIWDFGDGSARVVRGKTPPVTHTYAGPGTYVVRLILQDTAFCNSPDSISKTIRLSPNLKAQFTTPPTGCVPYTAVFQNTSLGGLNFLWDFGDGGTSTVDNPTHTYNNVGSYVVKLYAFDSTSCNVVDSTSSIVTVSALPTAAFIFSPVPPQENVFTQFTNQSLGAISYFWDFGDGDTSVEQHPRHLFNATGTFDVCLVATNASGCKDTICQPVSAIVKPLLDVPNAFTPGKFGVNGIITVQGFGIKEMKWSIYNRWGQKVFETSNRKAGWDGTFNGKLQPMDVYSYTLDVEFSDGKKLRKTGDITLLR